MKNSNTKIVTVGSFEVHSGKMMVSDPCYSPDTWCQGVLENVENGKWTSLIVKTDDTLGWGERVAELIVFHDSIEPFDDIMEDYFCAWEETDIDVGVDSGMAGFYDLPKFKGAEEDRDWYDDICNQMFHVNDLPPHHTNDGVIVCGSGVVSTSGYGDGGYKCYIFKNKNGKIDMAKIVFIDLFQDDNDKDLIEDDDDAEDWIEDGVESP